MPNDLDDQLVQKVMRGDTAALGTLLQSQQKRLYNTCLRMVGNRDDAAEITQDAMLKIVEHAGDFRGQSQITTWMTRIVMNLSISHLRKRRLRQTVSLDGPAGGNGHGSSAGSGAGFGAYGGGLNASGNSAGGGDASRGGYADQAGALRMQLADNREPGPVESVQNRELVAHLRTALDRLEEDFRGVLVLRDIELMDYQQIAEILGVPTGTVKSRLFRARLALRHEMLRLCPPPTRPKEAKPTPAQQGLPQDG
ncbi:MAG: sigma-70 family RNA polymerase sigma factor [Phycisphaera sp.]|nr:sigma-70 family RNA polymerase sigma factor [Phycisphaera sp.]